MNKTIYKYPLITTGVQLIEMPRNTKILSLQVQHEKPCIWCLVDLKEDIKDYVFRVYGTGETVSDEQKLSFVGTYQLYGGDFIGHVFLEI